MDRLVKPGTSNINAEIENVTNRGQLHSCVNKFASRKAKKRRKQLNSFKRGVSLIKYGNVSTPGDLSKKILEASRRVSVLIAKHGVGVTFGETLIKPAVKIMAEVIMGNSGKLIFDCIPLSKESVLQGIVEMSNSEKMILLSDISQSPYYTLQIDESTDVANFSNLMVFVRYEKNQEICEDFLFSKSLSCHDTKENIFTLINNFMIKNKIDWSKCVGVSTDGAKSMFGSIKGLAARIHKIAPNVIFTYTCIHRQALVTLQMPADLHKVLDECVRIINFIKNLPLDAHLFSKMFEGMGNIHIQLLYHTNARWLSQGNILNQLFELRHEIKDFLNDLPELKNCLYDWEWLCKLAYLADIFSILNHFSLSLENKQISVFHVQDKVNGIIAKLNLWQRKVNGGDLSSFPTLYEFVKSTSCKIESDLLKCIIQHLMGLQMCLKDYFPELNKHIQWMRQPFNISPKSMPKGLLHTEENELLELSSDLFLKSKYNDSSLASFWLQAKHSYPTLTKKVLKHILHFSNSHLCEVAFSEFLDFKSKKCNRHLDLEHHLRLKLTTKEQRYDNY